MAVYRKLKKSRGSESINQLEHLDLIGAKIVTSGVLAPGDVITADISLAGVCVNEGAICRIKVTADTYIAFGSEPSMPAVTSATTPALLLPAGIHLVIATDEFIRASAPVARLEVINS